MAAANYVLQIGGETYEIALDEGIEIKVGESYLPVKLVQKEVLTYKTANFSFDHPKEYSPSRSDLGDGIFQNALITSLGSLVLVQEYLSLDPSTLIDLMIQEVTKEEREYGYSIETSDSSKTLSDGTVLQGKVITSKYKGSDIKRLIYTYSVKDSGLLVLTQVDFEGEPSADALISDVIDSLKITMK